MSFVTFAILVFAVVALVLIVSRWGPSSSGKPVSPPVGPPCPNCGQLRGQVDRYCRRCGQQLSSERLMKPPEPPAQQ